MAVEELARRHSEQDSLLQVAFVWVEVAAASPVVQRAATVRQAVVALEFQAADVPFDLAAPCWAAAAVDDSAIVRHALAGSVDALADVHETRLL